MPSGEVYREEIRLSAIGWVAVAMLVLALVFIGLVFIDPFTASNMGNSQSGIFWIPATLFIGLAMFAVFIGKFTIVATAERLSVGAGMNSNSVAWAEIASAGEDYSRRPPCNVLTAMPTVLNGESVMVYAIGCLPRVELTLKNERLRRIIFPTRQPDVLLAIIQERIRNARTAAAEGRAPKDVIASIADEDRGTPDGVGGPPPFIFPI